MHRASGVPFVRLLDTNGNGTGTKNAAVDGSSTPVEFLLKPSTTTHEVMHVHVIHVVVQDGNGFIADEYGNLGSALTNGVTIKYENDDHLITDFTDGEAIKTNDNWLHYFNDVTVNTWGAGSQELSCRIDFIANRIPIKLNGINGDRLVVTINDSCTALEHQYFTAIGVYG